jgi:hypothetical protein
MLKRTFILIGCFVAPVLHAQLTPQAKQVAADFATQFESVGYVTTDFLDVDLSTGQSSRYLQTAMPLRWPFLALLAGLKSLDPDSVPAIERNYPAFVAGANNFQALSGVGMSGSTECFVGISEGADQPNLDIYFKKASVEEITGERIWTWVINAGKAYPGKLIKFYAARIGPNLEFCNTIPIDKGQESQPINSNPFIGLSVQLRLGTASMHIPASVTSHPLWLYRKVVQRTDPGGSLEGVQSLSLYADFPDNDHAAVNFEITKNPSSAETPQLETKPQWSSQKAGVWAAKVNLEGNRFTSSTDQVADMIGRLGFIVAP